MRNMTGYVKFVCFLDLVSSIALKINFDYMIYSHVGVEDLREAVVELHN